MQPAIPLDSDPTPDPAKHDPSSDDPASSAAGAGAGAYGRRFAPDERRCELCGFPLFLEHHCKIVCPNCGFTRDCSDP